MLLSFLWSFFCRIPLFVVNTVRGIVTHTDPRLANAKIDGSKRSDHETDKFDSNSTALQVIGNRSLSGVRVIVTGGSSGIGVETVRSMALRGASVTIACRSVSLGDKVRNDILSESPQADVDVWQLELTNLLSVVQFADRWHQSQRPLHILILNAGVCGPPHSVTNDGFETQFQINHLSQLYLLRLLLPCLVSSQPSRVVILSSESHRTPSVKLATFDERHINQVEPSLYKGSAGLPQYGDTKLFNILTAKFVNKMYSSQGVTAYSVHPGNMVYTNIQRQWWPFRLLFVLARPFTKTVEQGAATSVFCAVSDRALSSAGQYFNNCAPCATTSLASEPGLPNKLWDISDTMLRKWEERMVSSGSLSEYPIDSRQVPIID